MTLLGVGTAVPDLDRENTHMVWESPEGLLLVDAGGSTYQRLLRAGLDPLNLRGIVITHSHADHINGLPVLLFQLSLMGYRNKLPIYANQPTIRMLKQVLDAFELEEHVVAIEWITIQGGQELPLESPSYRVLTADTVHSRPCLALRFEERSTGKALVYSADTEPCPTVQQLAQGAEILIHEATTAGPFTGHTTPRQAGELAAQVGAHKLVLVHFSPRFTMNAAQAIEEVRTGGFAGAAEIGREFETYSL